MSSLSDQLRGLDPRIDQITVVTHAEIRFCHSDVWQSSQWEELQGVYLVIKFEWKVNNLREEYTQMLDSR